MTNLVSQSILAAKGVSFDGKTRLIRNNITIGLVEPVNGHYIMEKNLETESSTGTESFFTVKSETMSDRHHVLGHASHETIKHQESATQGVKVSDSTRIPRTNECGTCALSHKSHRIISPSPDKSESDLSQLTLEHMTETTYAIPPLDPATQITEIESDEQWELDFLAEWELDFLEGPSQGDGDEQGENKELDDDFHDANAHLENIHLPTPEASELSTPPSSQSLPQLPSQSVSLPPTVTSVRTYQCTTSQRGVSRFR